MATRNAVDQQMHLQRPEARRVAPVRIGQQAVETTSRRVATQSTQFTPIPAEVDVEDARDKEVHVQIHAEADRVHAPMEVVLPVPVAMSGVNMSIVRVGAASRKSEAAQHAKQGNRGNAADRIRRNAANKCGECRWPE